MPSKFLTIAEFARARKLSRWHVYTLIRRGRIDPRDLLYRDGHYDIRRDAIIAPGRRPGRPAIRRGAPTEMREEVTPGTEK